MVSLPEIVVSVEQDGENIYGLNAQDARVMEFEVKKGEWVVRLGANMEVIKLSDGREVVIEHIPEAQPLDIKRSEGFVFDKNKVPIVYTSQIRDGSWRETVLAWMEEDGLMEPGDWIKREYFGSFSVVLIDGQSLADAPVGELPYTFWVVDDEREIERDLGWGAAERLYHEREDKTRGWEPELYVLDEDLVNKSGIREGYEEMCFGHSASEAGISLPILGFVEDPEMPMTPFRDLRDYEEEVEHGRRYAILMRLGGWGRGNGGAWDDVVCGGVFYGVRNLSRKGERSLHWVGKCA